MLTIKQYLEAYPIWPDGSDTTDNKIRTAIRAGKLKARKLKDTLYIENVLNHQKKQQQEQSAINSGRLKEAYTAIKIKKEQQLLYDNRALLIDKAKDIFVNIYHNPRLQEFSEIVRKYGQGNKELIDAWNYQITVGLDEKSKELQLALAELITN